jgi:hypothetical protein
MKQLCMSCIDDVSQITGDCRETRGNFNYAPVHQVVKLWPRMIKRETLNVTIADTGIHTLEV